MVARYELRWKDGVKPTDPRIKTDENGWHTYTFRVRSVEDAKQVVRTFMLIQSEHNFTNFEVTNLNTKEKIK